MSLILGAIADDFTGATDLASTLVGQGVRVVQTIGVPRDDTQIGDAEAVVVALKSRTAPLEQAVRESLDACDWLRRRGAVQIFFKYCSTFDSTPAGNIGPVADALMERLAADIAFVCPAFPANARTVYQGHLFVGSELLSESPMRDHPLTPMRDSSLVRLMSAQSARAVGLVPHRVVRAGAAAIVEWIEGLKREACAYAVADAITDDDLLAIGQAAADHVLVTGGSAVAMGLPRNYRDRGLLGESPAPTPPSVQGRTAILAGSCSQATREQIEFVRRRWPCLELDVDAIAREEAVAEHAAEWASYRNASSPVVIYTSADPARVAALQDRYGRDAIGGRIESTFAVLARMLCEAGTTRLVVAGGETSGAVVSALGIEALRIGVEIDPGVPWTQALGGRPLALALKSGNFGGADFFAKAIELLDDR